MAEESIISFEGAEISLAIGEIFGGSLDTSGKIKVGIALKSLFGKEGEIVVNSDGKVKIKKDILGLDYDVDFQMQDVSKVTAAMGGKLPIRWGAFTLGFSLSPGGNMVIHYGVGIDRSGGNFGMKLGAEGRLSVNIDEAINRAFIKNPAPIGNATRTLNGQTTKNRMSDYGVGTE